MTRPVGPPSRQRRRDEHRAEELGRRCGASRRRDQCRPSGRSGGVRLGGDPAGEVDDRDLARVAGGDRRGGPRRSGRSAPGRAVPLVVAVGDVGTGGTTHSTSVGTRREERRRRRVVGGDEAVEEPGSAGPSAPSAASHVRWSTSVSVTMPSTTSGRSHDRLPATSARTVAARAGERPSASPAAVAVGDEPAAGRAIDDDVEPGRRARRRRPRGPSASPSPSSRRRRGRAPDATGGRRQRRRDRDRRRRHGGGAVEPAPCGRGEDRRDGRRRRGAPSEPPALGRVAGAGDGHPVLGRGSRRRRHRRRSGRRRRSGAVSGTPVGPTSAASAVIQYGRAADGTSTTASGTTQQAAAAPTGTSSRRGRARRTGRLEVAERHAQRAPASRRARTANSGTVGRCVRSASSTTYTGQWNRYTP